jgi:hypothetical protein
MGSTHPSGSPGSPDEVAVAFGLWHDITSLLPRPSSAIRSCRPCRARDRPCVRAVLLTVRSQAPRSRPCSGPALPGRPWGSAPAAPSPAWVGAFSP